LTWIKCFLQHLRHFGSVQIPDINGAADVRKASRFAVTKALDGIACMGSHQSVEPQEGPAMKATRLRDLARRSVLANRRAHALIVANEPDT
jgi:hypothetical protein